MNLFSPVWSICAISFLLTGIGCSYQPLTINGQVVDESGNALDNVHVWACYSGWGWSEEAGYLVWDKNYCSEPTQTNHDGLYTITFRGPTSSRLRAKKDGYVQTQDFNTKDSHLVLTRNKVHQSRRRAEAKQRDLEKRLWRPGESETDYYCRVIIPDFTPVNLKYKNDVISITPVLLEHDSQSNTIFSVNGLSGDIQQFSREIVIKVNGATLNSNFSVLPVETACGPDVHFIRVDIPDFNGWSKNEVEILVPSSNAAFDMQIWNDSENNKTVSGSESEY